ncbi:hypothetical protein B5M09_003286 [Aphanomyces astaci]|uniref:FZ domain-containing protein n=1 Tax=Aphanomyces astaci TaxID=112090 RepID=A0A425D3E2_APHAT|nr:hypothetical protein B5M09_003286 [Aphanomyces astaci]
MVKWMVLVVFTVAAVGQPSPTCSADTKFMLTTCAAEVQQSILYPRLQLPDRICRGVVCWPFLHRQVIPCVDATHILYERVRSLCPGKNGDATTKEVSTMPMTTTSAGPTSSSIAPFNYPAPSRGSPATPTTVAAVEPILAIIPTPGAMNASSVDASVPAFEDGKHVTMEPSIAADVSAMASALAHNGTNSSWIVAPRTTMGVYAKTPEARGANTTMDDSMVGDGETSVRTNPGGPPTQSNGATTAFASGVVLLLAHLS